MRGISIRILKEDQDTSDSWERNNMLPYLITIANGEMKEDVPTNEQIWLWGNVE